VEVAIHTGIDVVVVLSLVVEGQVDVTLVEDVLESLGVSEPLELLLGGLQQ